MAEKYYRVNTDNKTITINDKVKPSATEEKDVQLYLSAGYKLRHKSEARAEKARERAKKTGFGKKKENKAE